MALGAVHRDISARCTAPLVERHRSSCDQSRHALALCHGDFNDLKRSAVALLCFGRTPRWVHRTAAAQSSQIYLLGYSYCEIQAENTRIPRARMPCAPERRYQFRAVTRATVNRNRKKTALKGRCCVADPLSAALPAEYRAAVIKAVVALGASRGSRC
jgi:hypothetical protein